MMLAASQKISPENAYHRKEKVVTWWGRNLEYTNMIKWSRLTSPLVGPGDLTCCDVKSPASSLWHGCQEGIASSDWKELWDRTRSRVILKGLYSLYKTKGHERQRISEKLFHIKGGWRDMAGKWNACSSMDCIPDRKGKRHGWLSWQNWNWFCGWGGGGVPMLICSLGRFILAS